MTRFYWLLILPALVSFVGCAARDQAFGSSDVQMQINYTYPFDRPSGPNCFPIRQPLDPQADYRLRTPDGPSIPGQLDERSCLWIWQPEGTSGQVVQYRLEKVEPGERTGGVEVRAVGEDRVEVRIDGDLFTVFHLARKEGEFKPYLHPVIGPTDEPVTRDFPMKENPIEKDNNRQDHPHQRSLYSAHGDVRTKDFQQEGTNYWAEGNRENQGRQVVRRIARTVSGPVFGMIEAEIDWMEPDGKRQLAETRTYTFYFGDRDARMVDVKNVFTFPDGDVMFRDTKEGGVMAVRVAVSMDERGIETPRSLRGQMVNSRGGVGADQCWGKPAEWCYYYGPTLSDETVGIAVMDSPGNPRHPTYWHIRGYGLFTANPFGVRDFTGDKDRDGSLIGKQGERIEFNYRVLIHTGNAQEARVEDHYRMYRIPLGTVSE